MQVACNKIWNQAPQGAHQALRSRPRRRPRPRIRPRVMECWSTAPSPNCTRVTGRDAHSFAVTLTASSLLPTQSVPQIRRSRYEAVWGTPYVLSQNVVLLRKSRAGNYLSDRAPKILNSFRDTVN